MNKKLLIACITMPIISAGLFAYFSHEQNESRLKHFISAFIPNFDPAVSPDHRLCYGLYPLIAGVMLFLVLNAS